MFASARTGLGLREASSSTQIKKSEGAIHARLPQSPHRAMSFEDIEKARAKRTAKDIKDKGKHGRKRRSTALDADEPEEEPEAEAEVARAVSEA